MKIKTVILISVAAVSLYLLFGICNSKKEGYGGPIKNSRKIPMTDCFRICDNWVANCEVDRADNSGACKRQAAACYDECHYSNFQRF